MRESGSPISVNEPDFTSLCREIIEQGNRIRFAACGLSMAPSIRDGEIITVVPAKASHLGVGDILLYGQPGGLLTAHRVLGIVRDSTGLVFKTRGDASLGVYESVPGDRILGKVVSVERNGKIHHIDSLFARFVALAAIAFRQAKSKAAHAIRTKTEPQA